MVLRNNQSVGKICSNSAFYGVIFSCSRVFLLQSGALSLFLWHMKNHQSKCNHYLADMVSKNGRFWQNAGGRMILLARNSFKGLQKPFWGHFALCEPLHGVFAGLVYSLLLALDLFLRLWAQKPECPASQ